MKNVMEDVIVLLPGIMGSALQNKDGKAIWDLNVGAISGALFSLGGSLQELILSSETSTGDGVKAIHLMRNAHLIPCFWKIDGYSGLSEFIQSKFEAIPGENFFEFPYDWRLDNRISARRLKSEVSEWLGNRRIRYPDARLVLLAHSMGGLVARYFLEVLEGWRDTKMLISLGTPYRGSVKALDFLVNGLRKKVGPLNLIDLTSFVRSCTSAYQLLPIYPCVGETEENLKRIEEIQELGELDIKRAHAGIEFHREIQQHVEANRKNREYQRSHHKLLPVVGTYQPTFQSAIRTRDGIKPILTYKGEEMLGGDGTVPRLSATPIELSNAKAEIFVACPHAGLQNFDPVQVQIRAALSDVDISEIKAIAAEPISLEISDAFYDNEPFKARARCDVAIDPMRGLLTNIETGAETEHQFEIKTDTDEWQQLELPPLDAGTYRIRVEAGEESEPITDVFVVM
jgi:hypothetical protein